MKFSYSATIRNILKSGHLATTEERIAYCRRACIRADEYADVFGFVFADHSVILISKQDGKPV